MIQVVAPINLTVKTTQEMMRVILLRKRSQHKEEAENKVLKLVFMFTIQQYPLSLKFNQH
jgi:hypothetical protein